MATYKEEAKAAMWNAHVAYQGHRPQSESKWLDALVDAAEPFIREAARKEIEDQTKELAFQAFVAGAEFVGHDLEDPQAQFARHWEEQIGHAADAEEAP